ncbi:MAG: YHS domain-containing protein [Planctomyces sp.]|nr:YHS domain-containing protein [Planctomyces sp.]
MKRITALASVAVLLCAAIGLRAEEEKKKDDLKCPVSGAKVKMDQTVEHNGAKVYFCCENCPKAFKADTAKYAVKANAQIVASGQATQVKCPLSGGKLNPDAKSTVSGVEVQFCCNNCKGKVDKATGDDQLALVFSDEAFKKGYDVGKEDK